MPLDASLVLVTSIKLITPVSAIQELINQIIPVLIAPNHVQNAPPLPPAPNVSLHSF